MFFFPTQVHTFQLYAIVMCALFSALEVFFPSDLRLALLRAGFTLLQGSWFYCIGLVLYPPSGWERWDQDDHRQMMLVTMMFTWNVAGIVVFQVSCRQGSVNGEVLLLLFRL